LDRETACPGINGTSLHRAPIDWSVLAADFAAELCWVTVQSHTEDDGRCNHDMQARSYPVFVSGGGAPSCATGGRILSAKFGRSGATAIVRRLLASRSWNCRAARSPDCCNR